MCDIEHNCVEEREKNNFLRLIHPGENSVKSAPLKISYGLVTQILWNILFL